MIELVRACARSLGRLKFEERGPVGIRRLLRGKDRSEVKFQCVIALTGEYAVFESVCACK